MTAPSNRRRNAGWRRIAAGVVTSMAVALSASLGAPPAHAVDVIDVLVQEYGIGTGGGRVSNLLKQVVMLRAQGISPKAANLVEVQEALSHRPNQMPLINALSATLEGQQKVKSRTEDQGDQGQSGGVGVGINMGPWNSGGNPMIQDDPIFPMPGRS